MPKTINNMNDLEKALQPLMTGLVDDLADKVYEVLNYFLHKYYISYSPEFYSLTYEFLHSAIKTKAKIRGNKATAYVYIDYEALDNYKIPGFQVVEWANEGLHGGKNLGHDTPHVWDDIMEQTIDSGLLLQEALSYLKSRGIEVSAY